MQHDISKLRDQVQQISLSQRTTKYEKKSDMDGLKEKIEANMDGLKDGMKAKMYGLKEDMEGLKEGLKLFLQERLPGGDNGNSWKSWWGQKEYGLLF